MGFDLVCLLSDRCETVKVHKKRAGMFEIRK